MIARLRSLHPVLSTLFPPSCWATNTPISSAELGLSTAARLAIAHTLNWPYCRRCGATLGMHAAVKKCPRCEVRNLGVSSLARVGTFDPPLSLLVQKFKFHGHFQLAALLAPFVLQALQLNIATGRTPQPTALIPVPLHWSRGFTRGYNQSAELAHALSKLAHIPTLHALKRIQRTQAQSTIHSPHQRMENLRNAFTCIVPTLAGKHVVLIDDVCTTGATLHAAALALKRLPKPSRPLSIHAAVICVTDRVTVPPYEANTAT